MPLDEYSSLGGGALRLKGAKVTKKKKKKRDKDTLEKALSGGDSTALVKAGRDGDGARSGDEVGERERGREGSEVVDEEDRPYVRKTEAERRFEELKRKRVSLLRRNTPSQHHSLHQSLTYLATPFFQGCMFPAADLQCD
jgi:protein FAM32A